MPSMVYRGPSTGCAKCRERHTKCDGTRPACRRCVVADFECPGYRDFCGIIFKDVSHQVVARQSKRSRAGPKGKELRLGAPLTRNMYTTCVDFFFNTHIIPSKRMAITSRGHFDHLIPLYSKAAAASPLRLAAYCMAARAMAIHFGLEHNTRWHIQNDMIANRAISAAISCATESSGDEVLLAVLCLDFNSHLARIQNHAASSRLHLDGALALIQHRGVESFRTATSRSLFTATRSNVILQALWHADDRAQDAVASFPDMETGDANPIVALHHLLIRVVKFERITMKSLKSTIAASPQLQASSRVELGGQLEDQLCDWLGRIPAHWNCLATSPLPPASLAVPMLMNHVPPLHAASVIGQWYVMRLMIKKSLFAAVWEDTLSSGKSREIRLGSISKGITSVFAGFCSIITFIKGGCEICWNQHTTNNRASAVVGRGKGRTETTSDNKVNIYLVIFNLLRWILSIVAEEIPGIHVFAAHKKVVRYLFNEYDEAAKSLDTSSAYDRIAYSVQLP